MWRSDDGVNWEAFDARVTSQIEAAHASGVGSVSFTIRGNTYLLDLATMKQVASNALTRASLHAVCLSGVAGQCQHNSQS